MANRNESLPFGQNPQVEISRSKMPRNQEVKLTGNIGDVIPFYVDEVLPGDTFKVNTSKVVRLSTPITPFMDNIYLDTYYFFVPNRLVWKHWQNFMGESESAWYDPDVEYSIPQIKAPASTGWAVGGIADYLGYPTGVAEFEASALPIRAYAKICEDWFRATQVSDPLLVPLDDNTQTGTNSGSDYINDVANGGKCFKAGKFRDYFVSALPSPQFGDPVSINLGEITGSVFGTGKALALTDGTNLGGTYSGSESGTFVGLKARKETFGLSVGDTVPSGTDLTSQKVAGVATEALLKTKMGDDYDPSASGLVAEITGGNLITINELRTAFQIQKWQEKVARSGNRYIELIKGLFGVTSPDARLQRSEYLGGNRVPLAVNQVIQTSQTGTTPQGTTAAYSLTADSHMDFDKSFVEHGYVIGVMVARYHHTYQQGCERFLSRKTRFDFYFPQFANIGEQAILNKEIYAQGDSVVDEDGNIIDNQAFGYQEAWADYRYKPNRTAGEMRSTYTASLDKWHLGDNYNACPVLSDEWIREDLTNVDRVLTVTSVTSNQFIADILIENTSIRPMPLYSIPGLMDHH